MSVTRLIIDYTTKFYNQTNVKSISVNHNCKWLNWLIATGMNSHDVCT